MASTSVTITKDGAIVARLTMGQRPDIVPNADGRTLARVLAARRFVYHPRTREMAVFPDDQRFGTSPEWWLQYLRDALWPVYAIQTTE